MENLPTVNVGKSDLEKICDALALAGLVLFLIVTTIYWSKLPDTIPIHFDLKGNADGWGSKATIWLLPCIALFIYATMTLAAGLSPKHINYPVRITPENAERQYRLARNLLATMKTAAIWGLLGLTWLIFGAALSPTPELGSWPALVFVGSIFAIIVGYFVVALRK